MENGKVQNSEFENDQVEFTKSGPILGFLNRTIQKKHNYLKSQIFSRPVSQAESTVDSELADPRYSFKITGHQIKDCVEYQVVLTESKELRGKKCQSTYQFNTRYSKLLALHEKIQSSAKFPPKKFFNSKSPDFIEERRQQLEEYLNEIARESSRTFEKFVLQIKKANLHAPIRI